MLTIEINISSNDATTHKWMMVKLNPFSFSLTLIHYLYNKNKVYSTIYCDLVHSFLACNSESVFNGLLGEAEWTRA